MKRVEDSISHFCDRLTAIATIVVIGIPFVVFLEDVDRPFWVVRLIQSVVIVLLIWNYRDARRRDHGREMVFGTHRDLRYVLKIRKWMAVPRPPDLLEQELSELTEDERESYYKTISDRSLRDL